MSLKDQISEKLKTAMKENNTEERRVIRTILSSMKNIEIDNRATLSDQEIIAVLHKEIKIRNESIEGAQKNNRQDLIEEALADINIINQFIPAGLSDEEIRVITRESIAKLGTKNPSDMGKVMKEILPIINGRAPNSKVSQIVKELLAT
jgi:uncharacterized protein YqeY